MSNVVILAGFNHMMSSSYNSQMLPIRGKPALSYVIDEFYNKDNIILVLNKNNITTYEYISKRYPCVQIEQIDEDEETKKYKSFSILNSLFKGISHKTINDNFVKVVLGDTLCYVKNECKEDLILVSNDFISSSRWCLVDVDKNGFVKNFYDKQNDLDMNDKKAVVGYYQFTDLKLLKNICENKLFSGYKQISDVLHEYNEIHNINIKETSTWFDLGHKTGIIKAQNTLFNSRDFNSLHSNSLIGTITKTSKKKQKLKDEYNWYNNLPTELKLLTPRIVDFAEDEENVSITMEMYGYPALSELFILGNLSIEEWELIVEKLFKIHKVFEKYKGTLSKKDFEDLYFNKTWNRLDDLYNQHCYWKELYNYKNIFINNKEYKNISFFEEKLNKKIKNLIDTATSSIIHGDYCFSNILFDSNSFIFRFIDPRGRLKEQTIYGDPRYDIAKLRHSVVGGYDYTVHGLYSLKEDKNRFEISNNYPLFQKQLDDYFDKMVIYFGYNLEEIKLIEILLFMSMIPLHKDDMNRQKVFYLKAVKKINELFGEK